MSQQMERLTVNLEKQNPVSSRGSRGYETALFASLRPGPAPPSFEYVICSAWALLMVSVSILKPELNQQKYPESPSSRFPSFTFSSLTKPLAGEEGLSVQCGGLLEWFIDPSTHLSTCWLTLRRAVNVD